MRPICAVLGNLSGEIEGQEKDVRFDGKNSMSSMILQCASNAGAGLTAVDRECE
jgi:hypothetical protein